MRAGRREAVDAARDIRSSSIRHPARPRGGFSAHFRAAWFVVFLSAVPLLLQAAVHPPRALALSIDDETRMGKEFVAQIRAHFELLEDESANRFLADLGQYLLRALETKHFPYRFYILKNNTLNAFAAPGGHIFVFSGLIEFMDSVDELAAILCHEIGHISARHLSQRIEQSQKITYATLAGILAGVLLGGGPIAEALIVGSQAAGIQAQLHYSREDERQADQLGFKYMAPTGFDPKGLLDALDKIQKENYAGSRQIPSYLLTHPTGPERLANIAAMIQGQTPHPRESEAADFGERFPYFKAVVQAKCLAPEDALKRFEPELKANPLSPAANFAAGIAYTEASEYGQAVRHLEIARKGAPDSVPVLNALAEAYQLSGNEKKALQILGRALEKDPTDKQALYLSGLSYENLGDCGQSIPFFERIIALGNARPDVHYHLGRCYGIQNRLARAHYHFGIFFTETGEKGKALFHFKKAEELGADDPVMMRKIQEAIERPR